MTKNKTTTDTTFVTVVPRTEQSECRPDSPTNRIKEDSSSVANQSTCDLRHMRNAWTNKKTPLPAATRREERIHSFYRGLSQFVPNLSTNHPWGHSVEEISVNYRNHGRSRNQEGKVPRTIFLKPLYQLRVYPERSDFSFRNKESALLGSPESRASSDTEATLPTPAIFFFRRFIR